MVIKRFSLVKPTLDTPFHIDFSWWKQHDTSWRIFLQGYLCAHHQATLGSLNLDETIDWVDVESAEVQPVDGLQHMLITHCAKQEGFLTNHTTMVDSVFGLFLANGNVPLSPNEMGTLLKRPPETILRTLAGIQVYKGIRPCAS